METNCCCFGHADYKSTGPKFSDPLVTLVALTQTQLFDEIQSFALESLTINPLVLSLATLWTVIPLRHSC